ncbi:MAG: aminoacyl-histidine dipeptidase [Eubacterium sp.]|nr:aminoacyl-histidine dipeptidase [Eubacterium sp.]
MGILSGLKPEKVFYYFEELTKIPRGSYNEKAVSDYITAFAKERGFEVYQDSLYNVIIIRPASAGREGDPAVILQGHIDMVCEKTTESKHVFMKDPLDIYIDGDFIKAKGTTLGGDDGIAAAYMLAILDDPSVNAPRLECVFTTSEEVGMEGASGLDVSVLQGRQLINIDSEEEGTFITGCAGGIRAEVRLPLEMTELQENYVAPAVIKVSGLLGGHSGSDIDKQKINADRLLARALLTLTNKGFYIKVSQMSGGGKENAIPFESTADVFLDNSQIDEIKKTLAELTETVRNEYKNTDGNGKVELILKGEDDSKAADDAEKNNPYGDGLVMSDASLRKAIGLILAIPNGIIKMSGDIEGLVETSLNLGIMKVQDGELSLIYGLRSSVGSAKQALVDRVAIIAESLKATANFYNAYPAWEYKSESVLREKMVSAYEDMFGKKPVVTVIHAGLECGLLAEKLPGLDAVSFGPDMFDIHTVNERLSISSAARMYKYLLKVLEA